MTVTALCVAAVISGAWLYYLAEKDKIQSRVEAELSAIADLKAGQIIIWRSERLADARFFARAEFVARNIQTFLADPASPAARAETLDWLTRLKSGDRYEQVSLFDARQNLRLAVPDLPQEPEPALRAEVTAALRTNDVVMTDLQRTHPTNAIHLNLVFPVYAPGSRTPDADPSGSGSRLPIALVMLRLNPRDFLYPMVRSWPLPSATGEAALIRREGDRVLFVSNVRHVPNSALNLSFSINEPALPAAIALREHDGIVEGNDYRGVLVLAVIRRIPKSPWFLGVKVDQAEIYAPLRAEAINIGVAALALALAALGGLGWYWRGREARFLRREVKAGRALRASQERYRLLADHAEDFVALTDPEGNWLYVSPSYYRVTGWTPEELRAADWRRRLHPDDLTLIDRTRAANQAGQTTLIEHRLHCRDGSWIWMEARCKPLLGPAGQVRQLLLWSRDITERKRAEEALRESLQEKTALLQEVHHRVKNNLQIVASLLNLQAGRAQNPQVVDVLQDTRNRVRSMALLHEALYRSENLARVNFAAYVGELCAQLLRSYGPVAGRVRVENRVTRLGLPLEHSVPCGLIINELVSNALKHAFPDGRTGTVTVDLGPAAALGVPDLPPASPPLGIVAAPAEPRLVLRVSDDGVGLPAGWETANTATLGLKLVSNLAGQLGGRLTVEKSNGAGAVFTLVLPVPADSRFDDAS